MAKVRPNPRWQPLEIENPPSPEAALRLCEVEGCPATGEYPAPKSRDNLRDYHWFCLDHVKSYNARWDFLKGMNSAQIEHFIRESTVGERPSWPMGAKGKAYEEMLRAQVLRNFGGYQIKDPDTNEAAFLVGFTPEEARAFRTIGLAPTRDFGAIKNRYRTLAKQFHPDANQGSAEMEEKLKVINHAYGVLKGSIGAGTLPDNA